jgi:hypothetical protein
MALVADQGAALFSLNVIPKKSYLSEYASRISHPQTTRLMAAFQQQIAGKLLPGRSFNLDFLGFLAARSWAALRHPCAAGAKHPDLPRPRRRRPGVLLRQCRLRKGGEAEGLALRRVLGEEPRRAPRHLVFDSQLCLRQPGSSMWASPS